MDILTETGLTVDGRNPAPLSHFQTMVETSVYWYFHGNHHSCSISSAVRRAGTSSSFAEPVPKSILGWRRSLSEFSFTRLAILPTLLDIYIHIYGYEFYLRTLWWTSEFGRDLCAPATF